MVYALIAAVAMVCALMALPAGANQVTVAKGGHLMVNGQRFFPLGLYARPKGDKPFDDMAAIGFNLTSSSFDPATFDAAAKAGVYLWIPFGDALDLSTDREAKEAKIRETISRAKDHPALLLYESQDEPAWTWREPAKPAALPENLALGYQLVKKLDPNHPVTLNHAPQNTVNTLQRYNAACDAISVDIYPVIPRNILYMYAITRDGRHGDLRNQTLSCVGEYVDKMRQVAGPDRPVWMVLQGFAWADLDDEAKVRSSIVYPSYAQTRYMAWQSVIHGCNGILYWGTYTLPENSECWSGIAKTVRELADLSAVLDADEAAVAIEKDYDELGYSIDAGIETSVRDADGFRYLLAANSSIDPAAVTFSGTLFADGEVEVIGEGRTVPARAGAIHDAFKGLDVHLYRGRKPGL
jgi:hypothetical protein